MDPFDLFVRTSLIIVTALAVSAALRRWSAALRHWVVAAGIFAAASVVPLGVALPSWDLPTRPVSADRPLPSVDDSGVIIVSAAGAPAGSERFPLKSLAMGAWIAGALINGGLLLVGFRRLVRLTRRATPTSGVRWEAAMHEWRARYALDGVIDLLVTERSDIVATWGVRRACVLLPSHCGSWAEARIAVIIGHELAHVRRADWIIQIAAEGVCAVFWFNPLFWIACSRLRRESEQASDDAVLAAGVPAAEYASHLLDIARTSRPSPTWAAALPIARPSTLEWRITAMLNTTVSRSRPSRWSLGLALAALVGIAVPIATFRASAQTGPLPLAGAVYDTTGGVLPHVVLTLEDAQGATREATSDGSGRFDFGAVDPGRYVLQTSLPGFLPLGHDFTLRQARDWERAITLQVGTLSETISVRAPRPAGATAATVSTGPVRMGGNIRVPHKLKDVKPVYPAAMRDAGLEGVVPIEALIGIDGRVTSVRVLSAQVHPEFVLAAVAAVRQWRFSPTLLNGVGVEVLMTVRVQFTLE